MKIAATMIEAFRLFTCEDWMTEERLLGQIKRTEPKSPKAEKGTAFHEIIQEPQKCFDSYVNASGGELGFLASNGVAFPHESIKQIIPLINYHFPFELSFTKDYDINGEEITISLRVDQLIAYQVQDFKSIYSTFNYFKYDKSMQWKLSLDITGAESFLYHVFQFTDTNLVYKGKHPMKPFYAYPGMDRDITSIIGEAVEYIHFRNLESYFNGDRS